MRETTMALYRPIIKQDKPDCCAETEKTSLKNAHSAAFYNNSIITECPKTPSTGKSDFSKFNRQTCSDMIVGTKKKIASSTGRFNQSLTILDDTDIADESSALL